MLTYVQRLWRISRKHGRSSPVSKGYSRFSFQSEQREIRCMDLGKTALGNWKAQQGGCTHIQKISPFSSPLQLHAVLQRPQRPQVHELWHGILQTLPQAEPPHGGTRRPRIEYRYRHTVFFFFFFFFVGRTPFVVLRGAMFIAPFRGRRPFASVFHSIILYLLDEMRSPLDVAQARL
ncbi:hypothetical protein F5148DRAFT_765871 [Russula earlei]|uniref:Uncharacterized protein n=1 Tax=Russula earlei TaxID=71964 RepID=A0ACC0UCK5_9AGAM|nr:hypothetical protein F5148DRAFT_765871 [Russula earlei]